MSKQKKDKVDLVHDGVISEEAMLAFVNNELSATEKQELEKLLEGDPFAQDAVEGLTQTENKKEIATSIALVKRKLRERLGEKETRSFQIHWTNYAWAAALLGLLIGIGFVMVQYFGKSDNSIAMSQKEEPVTVETNILTTQEPPANTSATEIATSEAPQVEQSNHTDGDKAAETMVAGLQKNTPEQSLRADNISSTVAGASGGAQAPVAPATKLAKEREELAMSDDAAKGKSNVDERAKKDATVTISAEKSAVSTEPVVSESKVASYKAIATTTADSKQEAPKTASVDEAMKSFNSGDYKLASAQFDLVLKQTPENAAALYFGGISDYINGKTSKGEKNFDKLLKSGSQYVEGSKWYKANILLKKGKKDEAQRMLLELAATNGSYKERAAKKLEEVK